MQTIAQSYESAEYRIKSSRFIGGVSPVRSRADVDELLQRVKDTHPGASHICYAYRLAGRGTDITDFATDAGEPGGSAGTPILNVLRQNDLVDTFCWVVRYFGGTKLGIPGLIEAYSHTARQALGNTQFIDWIALETIGLKLPYAYIDRIKAETLKRGGKIIGETYDMAVELIITIPSTSASEFAEIVLELGNGQVKLLSSSVDYDDPSN